MGIISALHNQSVLWVSLVTFLLSSVTTFDKRLTQAKNQRNPRTWLLEPNTDLPAWTSIFIFLEYASIITLFILNWRYAIAFYIVLFFLAVLPVSETVGNLICGLIFFRSKNK